MKIARSYRDTQFLFIFSMVINMVESLYINVLSLSMQPQYHINFHYVGKNSKILISAYTS